MFVLHKTYRAAIVARLETETRYHTLLKTHNAVVERINKLGGEDFLQRGENILKNSQFSPEEIDRLIRLCHPYKHGNSEASHKMTARLLDLRRRA